MRRVVSMLGRMLPAPINGGFSMPDYWIWCGSVIQGEDGRYHMFASRWPKTYPFFNGYKAYSEIVRAVSMSPNGPYIFEEVVLPRRDPMHWDGKMTHNPTIHKYGQKYLLFYIGSTYSAEDPSVAELSADTPPPACRESYENIRIGMAIADSVFGPWERLADPILSIRPEKWDQRIVTNPAPCVLGDGSILLYYRSNTPDGLRIGVAKAKGLGEPFVRISDEPVLTFNDGSFVEDPYVWWTGERIELLAKDMTGGITGEKHAGVQAWSRDGIAWELCQPPKAYSRKVVWENGEVTVQGSLERPQLLIKDGKPTHLFAATADGPGGFYKANHTWNMVIPLKANQA